MTDHKPLAWLFSVKDPGSRLMRWRLKLEEYNYKIIHRSGKSITHADALSRIYVTNLELIQPVTEYQKFLDEIQRKIIINNNVKEVDNDLFDAPKDFSLAHCVSRDLEMSAGIAKDFVDKFGQVKKLKNQNPKFHDLVFLKENKRFLIYLITKEKYFDKPSNKDLFVTLLNLKQFCCKNNIRKLGIPQLGCGLDRLNWEDVCCMIKYIFKGTNIEILVFKNKIKKNLSRDEIEKILKEYHTAPLGGHQGVNRTYRRIREIYRWDGMYRDIKKFIKKCELCQKNKFGRKTKIPMVITTTSKTPFEKIFLDIVGPLAVTFGGNKYILTFQDDLTKFTIAIPIPNQESLTVATNFVTKIVCLYGIPKSVLTDQGTNFLSQIFKDVCKILKISKLQTNSFHPMSIGALERHHKFLGEYLRNFTDNDQQNWDEWIPYCMFAYNTTPHTATKFSRYELLFGFKPEIPSSIQREPEFRYNYDNYVDELKARLQHSYQSARENILRNKEKYKYYYDKNLNDKEFEVGNLVLLSNESVPKGKSKKLTPLWKGPYEVTKVTKANCEIKYTNKLLKVHKNRLKLFYV